MPKCGIFINFVFCRQLLKNERISVEKKAKRGQNNNLCRYTTFICRDTKFKQAKGTMLQPTNLCRSKDSSELKVEMSFLGCDCKVFCRNRT